jgi:sulfur carrier protein ThiS adenylyltransferase
MNNFLQQGLTKYLEKTELSKIKNTKILIAGAGGVGSNAAMLLVRCGFEKITIIDYDELEPSNLNRQFFFNEQVGTKNKSSSNNKNNKRTVDG